MKTLVLEPHFDDTAYSMSGLLLSGSREDEVLIVTVFSKCAFAPYANVSGIEEVSAFRLQEHKQFCEAVAVEGLTLNYHEAPQRGWPMDSLFYHLNCGGVEKELIQSITGDLENIKNSFKPHRVFAPLGICGHLDHVMVRQCSEKVFSGNIHFYEELPYAGEIDETEYNTWIQKLTVNLHPAIQPAADTIERRLEYLKIYSSQVAEKDLESVRKYLRIHQGDRYWSKI